jgi:hypothetical protein
MKIKLLALFICVCTAYSVHAQNVTYDSLRTAIVKFLSETEDCFTDMGDNNILGIGDYVSKYQIGDERDLGISGYKKGVKFKTGMYSFYPSSSYCDDTTYIHLVLIDKDGFQIINMRQPIEVNLKMVIDFLQNNHSFTKKESLLHLQRFVEIYGINRSPWSIELE